jgi:hypothetical protein
MLLKRGPPTHALQNSQAVKQANMSAAGLGAHQDMQGCVASPVCEAGVWTSGQQLRKADARLAITIITIIICTGR